MSTVESKEHYLTPECVISLGNQNLTESTLGKYGDELAFYQFYNTKQIFARLNLEINGLLPNWKNEVFRIFENDTYLSEVGMSRTLETSVDI